MRGCRKVSIIVVSLIQYTDTLIQCTTTNITSPSTLHLLLSYTPTNRFPLSNTFPLSLRPIGPRDDVPASSNTCTESSTIDTRACVCGDIRDRNQCGDVELRKERTCAPTEVTSSLFRSRDWLSANQGPVCIS